MLYLRDEPARPSHPTVYKWSPGLIGARSTWLGLSAPGVDRVSAAAYDALGLMSYYTVGEDECRAWTIRKGALAPEAGGSIHSDIERGFIRAEVMAYEDFVAAGSEVEAKNQGLMQTRGRDYVVEDGDIMHFLFNV